MQMPPYEQGPLQDECDQYLASTSQEYSRDEPSTKGILLMLDTSLRRERTKKGRKLSRVQSERRVVGEGKRIPGALPRPTEERLAARWGCLSQESTAGGLFIVEDTSP